MTFVTRSPSAENMLDIAPAASPSARLWAGMCRRYADYQRRRVAAAMYAVLSKLADEELANRGIARADLARFCGLKSYSTDG